MNEGHCAGFPTAGILPLKASDGAKPSSITSECKATVARQSAKTPHTAQHRRMPSSSQGLGTAVTLEVQGAWLSTSDQRGDHAGKEACAEAGSPLLRLCCTPGEPRTLPVVQDWGSMLSSRLLLEAS